LKHIEALFIVWIDYLAGQLRLATAWIEVIASLAFRFPATLFSAPGFVKTSQFCLVVATSVSRFHQQPPATVDERLNKCLIQFVALRKYF
jgi:hypothetical protein